MSALATIADVEAVSRPVPDSDVPRVTRLLDMVSAHVVRYTGQRFDEETETINQWAHDGVLRLPQHPVTAIASLAVGTAVFAASTYTFTANGYIERTALLSDWWGYWNDNFPTHDTERSYIADAWPGRCGWPHALYTIRYTHGYPAGTSPDDVALVVAETVATKWQSGASQASRLTSETIDSYSQTWSDSSTAGDAWLPAHKQILDTYRRSGLASVRLT